MARSRRDDLVECAARLFAREGFHSTGIDRLLAEAGCAKMTLYNHFGGKDELIAAALEATSDQQMARLEAGLRGDGLDRALSFFDALGAWFSGGDFHGCLFLNAAAEFKDPAHPVRRVVAEHSNRQRELLRRLVKEAGVARAAAVADQLMLLAEGAIEVAKVSCCPDAAKVAKRAARTILEAASAR